MNISQYISDLLFLHDCVIIPGLGGFVANYKTAQIRLSKQNTILTPPEKQIAFNASLIHNDGLLINYIAEQKEISYNEASKLIGKLVKHIYGKLEKGTKILFPQIGAVYYDKFHTIQFKPATNTNFLLDAFGLPSLTVQSLEQVDNQEKIKNRTPSKTRIKQVLNHKVTKYTLIIIPAIALLVFGTDYLKNIPGKNTNYSSLLIDYKSADTDEKNLFVEPSEKEPDSATLFLDESQTLETNFTTNTIDVYYAIAGSFNSIANAGFLKNKLIGKNYDAEVIQSEKGSYRVILFKNNNKNETLRFIDSVSSVDKDVKSLWLFHQTIEQTVEIPNSDNSLEITVNNKTIFLLVSGESDDKNNPVTFSFNDEKLLKHIKLSEEPRELSINLSESRLNYLLIRPDEQENTKPFTSVITFFDGTGSRTIRFNSINGEDALIRFRLNL